MATRPRIRGVKQVAVTQQRNGEWMWSASDAQGHVRHQAKDYATKWTAARGARRACGARVRVIFEGRGNYGNSRATAARTDTR